VYDDMKVIEYLEFFAAAYRIHGPRRRQVCEQMLETVDLAFKRDAMANTLSRGQTQRLGLARVLLHDPQVLLLDEPLSGLDPRARIDMRNLLKSLGEAGKTIIVSSHILPELADVCNKIGVIEKGQLQVNASVAEVMRQVRRSPLLRIRLRDRLEEAARQLEADPMVASIKIQQDELAVTLQEGSEDFSGLLEGLVRSGFRVREFSEDQPSLESAFMLLTKGA
jgi:ABC-2 type transport system ATP-binding protein